MKIEHLIYLDGCLLCVFYTNINCWQYSIFFNYFSFYDPYEFYCTSNAAVQVGKDAIQTLRGC
ncbi:hypothetical protein [Hyella patelloides]|uniref:hypothetical protein n=1 Tax=Hyella patelloides TaxID=1982969 RepID=UPI00119D2A28|nr:hypothetical protein [Hyella patelloides]